MKNLFNKIGLLVALLMVENTYAAGSIELLEGNVNVINARGELRAPAKGERVEAGDTIVTGKNGEVHIVTDDQGLLAIRPNTQLKIDEYRANGNQDDAVVLNLLRGTFRSITGWIGKKQAKRYQVKTVTATIGIRGTDHEPLVIDEGSEAGTYDKVNAGGTRLDTAFGQVDISPQQVGFVPKSAITAPVILDKLPSAYQATPNEAAIETKKEALEKSLDDVMKEKQEDNTRQAGGNNAPQVLGDFDDRQNARMALDELLRRYELGDVNYVRSRLDGSMIGYQKLLDDITTEHSQCKQLRVNLLNTQVQAGPDLAVVQTSWEKRCLMLPNFTPRLDQGNSTFLMHRGQSGWYMAGLTGSNPFNPPRQSTPNNPNNSNIPATVKTLATLTASTTLSCSALTSSGSPTPYPFSIALNDPDKAGAPSVNVTLTMGTESENVVLTAAGGGTFVANTLNFYYALTFALPTHNDGLVGLHQAPSSVSLPCPAVVLKYTDATTPSGVPQLVQTNVAIP